LEQQGKPSWWPLNPYSLDDEAEEYLTFEEASEAFWDAVRIYLNPWADFIPEEDK